MARVIHAQAGTVWESQDSSVCIVIQGCVEVVVESEGEPGREVIMAVLCENDFFGELRLLEDQVGVAFVRALTDCELLRLEGEPFLAWLRGQPKVLMRILAVEATRLRRAARFTARKAKDRVCALLAQLADRDTGEVKLSRQLTQRDLAALAGVGRETFNRILGGLPAGLVEIEMLAENGHLRLIKVLDKEKLQNISGL